MTAAVKPLSARMRDDIRSTILALAAPDRGECGEALWKWGVITDDLSAEQREQRVEMMMDVWREVIVTVRWQGEKQ